MLLEWRKAVAEHQPGVIDGPVKTVGMWSSADLRMVVEGLRPLLAPDDRRDPGADRLLLSGAMLGTDIAMLAPRRRITSAPGDRFVSLSIDGRDFGQQPLEPCWAFARQLLAEVSPAPAAQAAVKLWYRAVASHMAQYSLLGDIGPHLEQARRLFPDDPDVLFDTGGMYEGLASPRTQAALDDMIVPRGFVGRVQGATRGESLGKAEEWYTRTLAASPNYHEARLRRGRVRSLRGNQPGAIADLRAVAAAVTEPYVKYHALLFLGGAYEALDRIDDARAAYERAAATYAYAQSPHLALSRLATRRGDMPAAQRHISQVLRLSPDAPNRGDPFWSYYTGSGRRHEALLESLRDAVAALVGPLDGARDVPLDGARGGPLDGARGGPLDGARGGPS
jgi:hypothetical protein